MHGLGRWLAWASLGLIVWLAGCGTAPPPVPASIPLLITVRPVTAQPKTTPTPRQTPTAFPTIIIAHSTPTRARTATRPPPLPTGPWTAALLGGGTDSNVARAHARLWQDGLQLAVLVVSPRSEGVQQEIYRDLVKRNLRATTGPDEGFDTRTVQCFPNCVFVPLEAVNSISVESWVNVLRHEQRHMVQAANNPDLAQAFRPDHTKPFTTYAAFLEVCADDGIYVGEPFYHTLERMSRVRAALDVADLPLLKLACEGNPTAYNSVVNAYERKAGGPGSFASLFPPYR